MAFDAALALRMITNSRLRTAQGWGDYRDLQGALCVTSDAPIAALNCLNGFTTDERNVESILDIGFALLRAFDCAPVAQVTPLDRPRTLAEHLRRRRMAISSRGSWMVHRGDASSIGTNAEVAIRKAEPDDAPTFAAILDAWARRMSVSLTMSAMLDPGNTFYLAYIGGQAVGTLHLLVDGTTAGIYAVGTMRTHRRKGVSSTLIARAIVDARAAGCDLICLSTEAGGYAEGLYAKLGFETLFESQMWVAEHRS